ncbi:MAG: NADH-quinone oxidoreductase subunit NuoK [Candidatus Asgardarchaeia archaeon]
MLPIMVYFILSIGLLGIGLAGVTVKRNLIKILIGIETMLASANLNFILFSMYFNNGYVDPLAQTIVIISMAVGASVIAVALTLTLKAYEHYKTLDTSKMNKLKW